MVTGSAPPGVQTTPANTNKVKTENMTPPDSDALEIDKEQVTVESDGKENDTVDDEYRSLDKEIRKIWDSEGGCCRDSQEQEELIARSFEYAINNRPNFIKYLENVKQHYKELAGSDSSEHTRTMRVIATDVNVRHFDGHRTGRVLKIGDLVLVCKILEKDNERWLAIENDGNCKKPKYIPRWDDEGRPLVSVAKGHIKRPMSDGEADANSTKAEKAGDLETARVWEERTWAIQQQRNDLLENLLRCLVGTAASTALGALIGPYSELTEEIAGNIVAANAVGAAITSDTSDELYTGTVVGSLINITLGNTVFAFVLQVAICMALS